MYLSESTSLQLSNALSLIDLSQKLAEIHPLKVRYIRVLRVHFFTSTSLRGPTEWAGMWAPCLVKYISLCTFQVEDILVVTESRVCEIIGDAL